MHILVQVSRMAWHDTSAIMSPPHLSAKIRFDAPARSQKSQVCKWTNRVSRGKMRTKGCIDLENIRAGNFHCHAEYY